ncbi:RagB/SusD family nutrient uptake outer membrane protein [Mucilaginibacter hurinus]|uniref:RagB/SusD family nutrient uptake outer membrane protein n=1 Tax=Mucilaginibacter hurinus TaxID=2201324 RepID=A0A367GQW6_9SPHI|nr:RagB/SusD family nutrient uptake outer membrane protein [Mucilaginibacter hurinus]RCH55864.1 RagB/SusD family nutrient uptake outer membrane protein [Mucilaginibacter hurinus]
MKIKYIKSITLLGVLAVVMSSCHKDLNRKPFVDVTSASVYEDFKNYKGVLAKCYGALALTGQGIGDANPDIGGVDVGYVRGYWQLQELTTDEAVIAWNDQYLLPLHSMDWTSLNGLVGAMYNRISLQVMYANEYLRRTTDAELSRNGITNTADLAENKLYRAECRFLRAYSYWHAIDMYGSVPLVTENDPVGAFFPKQASRAELFNFVESELKAIENELAEPHANEYGRVDRVSAWMLLAKLYLNAEVYTGSQRNADVITYCNKVINSGYSLEPNFAKIFLADNHLVKNEIIFTIPYDGVKMKTFNGTTFLVHAPVGGNMNAPRDFGIDGGWFGLRTTSAIVKLFPDITGKTDSRAMFHSSGQKLEINSLGSYADGYPITKWKNLTSSGVPGSDPGKVHVDTDFPVFRISDAYLMYAEAVLRGGGGGDISTALQYVNLVRTRAYKGSNAGNINANQLTLNFIIDERGREFMWEGQRRTDLVRFKRFTGGDYIWPWKGGVKAGSASVPAYRDIFPLPYSDLVANPSLKQNPGYN